MLSFPKVPRIFTTVTPLPVIIEAPFKFLIYFLINSPGDKTGIPGACKTSPFGCG
jgi:hypothetical protein